MKITREELYRRVWETPVRTLAKEFDISDVGLAKACRRNRIPLPPVGYWMKVQHGKAVTKPPLSKSDSVEVTLQASRYRIPAPPASVEALKPPQLQVPLPETTDELAPVASATFKNLLKAKADIRGMVSCQGTNVFSCDVAPGTVERAVRILHAIESALPVIGAKLVKASKENRIQVERDGLGVLFRLNEQYTRTEHVIKDKHYSWMDRKEYTYFPNGKLTFQIEGYYEGRKTWSDGTRESLDTKLPQVVTGLLAAIESIRERELEWKRQRIRSEEAARIREELERKRRAEEEFRRQLLADAKTWSECEAGFAYLEQVKGQLVGKTADLSEPAREWLSHAEQALTEMSPLGRRVQGLIAPIGGEA